MKAVHAVAPYDPTTELKLRSKDAIIISTKD
jgi:hypothetical protein